MELNYQAFQEIYGFLHSRDEGLVCSSRCNTNTMKETPFEFLYILRPSSDNGVMLHRKLAGSEEALDVGDSIKSSLREAHYAPFIDELENSIKKLKEKFFTDNLENSINKLNEKCQATRAMCQFKASDVIDESNQEMAISSRPSLPSIADLMELFTEKVTLLE